MMHMETIRAIQADFLGMGLSMYHKFLDGVLADLDEIDFSDAYASKEVFNDVIWAVFNVKKKIENAAETE